ncbi:MAG: death-on-curing family protein [Geminicoccaceae bacterium]|jgi:death-on-curing protein|nr:death-on-curing family protein [Geminicoccaceae bacterium]MDF2781785.1 death-on-curing family protein [Geminicoccaceae bacterium]
MEPVWVARELVHVLHERLLAEHGGAPGLRDEGLLDSALARPRQIRAYGDPDLCALAAAYAYGLVQNHPFVDGNKRVAFMVAYVFLARNGRRLVAPEADATAMVMALAAGQTDEKAFAAWLRDQPLP